MLAAKSARGLRRGLKHDETKERKGEKRRFKPLIDDFANRIQACEMRAAARANPWRGRRCLSTRTGSAVQ